MLYTCIMYTFKSTISFRLNKLHTYFQMIVTEYRNDTLTLLFRRKKPFPTPNIPISFIFGIYHRIENFIPNMAILNWFLLSISFFLLNYLLTSHSLHLFVPFFHSLKNISSILILMPLIVVIEENRHWSNIRMNCNHLFFTRRFWCNRQ